MHRLFNTAALSAFAAVGAVVALVVAAGSATRLSAEQAERPAAKPAAPTQPSRRTVAPAPRTDGRWELSLQTQYNGRALTSQMTQCVTKEQAADPMNTLPGGPEAQQGCRMSNYKVTGMMVTWTVSCDGPPPATTQGEYVYQADSYTGVMRMQRAGQSVVTRVNGKRVGDCVGPVAGGR